MNNTYNLTNVIQKKINSFLYRLILVFYALVLVLYYNDSLYFLIWIGVYYYIFTKLLEAPRTRLLLDIVFIFSILYRKDPDQILTFILLILPIINSINFSSENRSYLLYIIILFEYLLLTYIYQNFKFSNISPINLYPLFFIFCVDFYSSFLNKVRTFREKLYKVVESYYLDINQISKPHKIYHKMIEEIKVYFPIFKIACFTINRNKISLVNCSKFIWKYDLDPEIAGTLRKRKVLYNYPIMFDDVKYPYSIIIYLKVKNIEYVFILLSSKRIPIYFSLIGITRIIEPALFKVAMVLVSEQELEKLRDSELKKLAEKMYYVSMANKSMHYIRNKLGPIANLIKMIDSIGNIPTDKYEEAKKHLIAENGRATNELANIKNTADYLLEKRNNPFNFSSTNKFSLERVFTMLKKNFELYFPEKEITIIENDSTSEKYLALNEAGFEIFLSDWLHNMKKYCNFLVIVEFIIGIENIHIVFRNDYKISQQDVNSMINDLMSSDRNQILKRTTHGLYQIKSILQDMAVEYKIGRNILSGSDVIELSIRLKILRDESTDI